MGWSESYYRDMATEAALELEERLRELEEAFGRLRGSASTYRHFHPLYEELVRRVEVWETELEALRRKDGS
ncbi:MAG: hypothetical protein HPY75_05140 [Actinobacteria bacterium]|nr:hypothetical protein [Actinomycetota bacterium]